MRFALPHPLTPSPRAGEGGQDPYSPLPFWERGWGLRRERSAER